MRLKKIEVTYPLSSDTGESGERKKKHYKKFGIQKINHEETVGMRNIFAILSSIIDCTEVAQETGPGPGIPEKLDLASNTETKNLHL